MPKVPDPIPSRSFSIQIIGDDLDTLTEIVNESHRLKPEWKDTPQSVLASIVEDFLGQPDAFDQFVLTRVDAEQRDLLRQIAELKHLKKAARAGTLEDGDGKPDDPAKAPPGPTSGPKPSDLPPTSAPPPLGSVSPTVR
jgi:hypothetical protein